MNPRASQHANSTSESSIESKTPTLLLLKNELGDGARLLDDIPLDAVTMVQTTQFDNCLPCKIHIGTVNIDGAACDAWAVLSSKLYRAQDGTPRMLIYAATKGGTWIKYQSEHLSDKNAGQWAEVFRSINTSDRRTLLVKVSQHISNNFGSTY